MQKVNDVAKYIQLNRISSIPDSELIIGRRKLDLPEYHWCRGCQWGTNLGDRYMCPFVYGSCARIPWSLENPNHDMLHKRIMYEHESEKHKSDK